MILSHMFWLLFLGIVAGMAVALPYGPVGFVIIRRFYLFGMGSGMYSALGNAISDGFYAIVIGFGLHRIQHFLLSIAAYAEIGAGIALVYLGYKAVTENLSMDEQEQEKHPFQDITSTFFINLMNPTLLFSFALVFTILSKILHGSPMSIPETAVFIAGIPMGTCLLWFGIGSAIRLLRHNNKHALVERINYVTGAILGITGAVLLVLSLVHAIF